MITIKIIRERRQPHQADLQPQLVHFMEKLVSQLDDLMAVLTAVRTDVSEVREKVANLEEQLTTLQQTTPPQVDLSAAISLASEIRSQLEAAGATAEGATGSDQPEPAPEPTDATPGEDQNGADTTSEATGDQSGTDATP